MIKSLPANAGDSGREDPREKGMAIHSSILAWKIPWTEEPGRLQVHGVAKSQIQLSTRSKMYLIHIMYT